MEKKQWKGWKVLAIIFIILFILENLWVGYGFYIIRQEERKITECYYDVCEDYPEAELVGNVCFCYDYDLMGNFVVVDTEIMK